MSARKMSSVFKGPWSKIFPVTTKSWLSFSVTH